MENEQEKPTVSSSTCKALLCGDVERELRGEISDLKRTMLRLIACLAVELGANTAKSLIAEININDKDS